MEWGKLAAEGISENKLSGRSFGDMGRMTQGYAAGRRKVRQRPELWAWVAREEANSEESSI